MGIIEKYEAFYDALPNCYILDCKHKAMSVQPIGFSGRYCCDAHSGPHANDLPYAEALRELQKVRG